MTGLEICTAASPEALLPALCDRLRAGGPADPFALDWLILPAPGLRHWLARRLSQELGICSGLSWLLPEMAARELIAAVPGAGWPEPALTSWRLLPMLAELPEDPAFALLRDYLGVESSHRPALARRLAELYLRYALYRPGWLEAWEQALPGPEAGLARWQAWLWRDLGLHLPYSRLASRLAASERPLPARIQVFACSSLPPLLLRLLEGAAARIPVTLHQLDADQTAALPASIFDFNAGLRRAGSEALGRLGAQASPARPGASTASIGLSAGSPRSLSLSAVADPLRELEVLRDWLLARFAAQPDLRPDEVLIATPTLGAYAPLLPLVFGRKPALAVQVLGRPPLERSALLQAFERVLGLADSRLARADVLALLECEPVARRFDLDADERALCRHWLDAVSIRWGWDASQRLELTSVAFGENSWQAGLERLLLGYALGAEAAGLALYQGISPYLELEGSQGQTLAKLLALLEALRALGTQLRRRRPPERWAPLLESLLERFLQPDESGDWELIVSTIGRLRSPELAGLPPVGAGSLRAWLSAGFGEFEREQPPDGRLLLAPLDWIQQVPARVICLLGLHERGFPRHDDGGGDFDAMARAPQPGDPMPRSLDREYFLAALLAAREAVWIGYQGLSPRDGSRLPPAAPVAELLEHWQGPLTQHFHPLHAHDPRCFAPGAPASYRPDALALARRLSERQQEPALAYCREPLAPEPEESLALENLLSFWRNPAAAFLRSRLQLGYLGEGEPADDSEALELPGLQRYQLNQELLQVRRSAVHLAAAADEAARADSSAVAAEHLDPLRVYEPAYAAMAARSLLPVARIGRIRFEELANRTESFVQALEAYLPPGAEGFGFALELGGERLSGQLELCPEGLSLSRFGRIRAQELLEAWIQHLVLQLIELPPDWPATARRTRLLGDAGPGQKARWRFEPVPLAGHWLEQVLRLTREGLSRPLPYFPASARAYAETLHKGRAHDFALLAAEGAWLGRPGQPGEQGHPAWRACFRHEPVLDQDFTRLALAIWQPLLEALHAD